MLHGTDYPFWDGRKVSDDLAKGGFSAAKRMAIDRNNVLRCSFAIRCVFSTASSGLEIAPARRIAAYFTLLHSNWGEKVWEM